MTFFVIHIVMTVPETGDKARKSEETELLLKKLKDAYEIKFKELEHGNQIMNQEIQGFFKAK